MSDRWNTVWEILEKEWIKLSHARAWNNKKKKEMVIFFKIEELVNFLSTLVADRFYVTMYPIHEFFEKNLLQTHIPAFLRKTKHEITTGHTGSCKRNTFCHKAINKCETKRLLQRDNPAKVLTDSNAFEHSAMIKILVQNTAVNWEKNLKTLSPSLTGQLSSLKQQINACSRSDTCCLKLSGFTCGKSNAN